MSTNGWMDGWGYASDIQVGTFRKNLLLKMSEGVTEQPSGLGDLLKGKLSLYINLAFDSQ